MTEKEKAAAGLLYDANYDPQLIEERARAKDLCLDYNLTRSSQKEERLRLLRMLLASCGEDTVIEPPIIHRMRSTSASPSPLPSVAWDVSP